MKKWSITQSELFEMYLGIHYNINCRSNCTDISEIDETLKKTSIENKRKVFENIYSAEEDKRMIDTVKKTEKFKNAEIYGHKLKAKKSKSKTKSIFKLFSKRRSKSSSSSSTTKRKNRI